MSGLARLGLAIVLTGACRGEGATGAPEADPDRPTTRDPATRWLEDRAFRREQLEASLTSHENLYARRRLENYATPEGGWDRLPVWRPAVHRIRSDARGQVERVGAAIRFDDPRPTDGAAWRALGVKAFDFFPLRAEAAFAAAIESPARAAELGLERDDEGNWIGLVDFVDLDGQRRVGITCALCHTARADTGLERGRARRRLDYGALRVEFGRLGPEQAARESSWGPGRADVSDDADADPVAIPDLWSVGGLRYLTQGGTLRQLGLPTLAMRQETQIIYAQRERIRPPRELAWAMAVYVSELRPSNSSPSPAAKADSELGRTVFDRHCASCHEDDNGSGGLVPAAQVGSDPALALGRARGTGAYRPAPLIDLERAAPYLHDASIPSLDALLDPERLRAPDAPHRFGAQLDLKSRAALLAWLRAR